jgi:dienelactone hydrolase
MRSPFWFSALLLLVVAGCGHTTAHRAADPFAYNTARPLAVRQSGVAHPNKLLSVHVLSFAGASGRVDAFLLVPNGVRGRMPAVVFLHGAGGNREDFLIPAAILAERGVVTMTISQPNDAFDFKPLVVNARRALDLLAARSDVDPKRLGLVGYSLGAQTAAVLAGDEPRLETVGIVAGRGTDVTTYWMRRAHARLFFQAGTLDEVVPHRQLVALIAAAPGHPRVRWYRLGHSMNLGSMRDQDAWQAEQLDAGKR